MAQGLGIQTIAEFVDSDETVQILKAIGVDYAQGYHVGKPSPHLLDS
jgi:EAL domain-containing protein (putative c-di-GMP-specific phosphodiesterase class I)